MTDYAQLSSMNRRRFLAFCGLGIGTAGGYIGWRWYHSPSILDGMRAETQHLERDILTEESSRDSEFLEWQEEHHTIINNMDAANREIIDDDSVTPFLDNTDFEESSVIVVQNGMQSEMELVLDTISRRENGIHLDITIDSPRSGPDDLLIHSILIRITDEDGKVPEEVSVDIEGYV